MQANPTKRREERYQVQLALVVRQGARNQEVLTENVSYRGVFIRTDRPPPLRQLVKLEGRLEPDGTPFTSHGMSVFVVAPGNAAGRAPGAGIQFYGMGDERKAWERFVNHVKGARRATIDPPLTGPEPIRRMFERVPLTLEVRPRSVDELVRMWSRDVSAGGMFLTSTQRFQVGDALALLIKHPTTDATYSLDATVRRVSAAPPGIGVEFTGLTDDRRGAFFRFATSAMPVMTAEELGLLEIE